MTTTATYPPTVDALIRYGDITFVEPMAMEAFLQLAHQMPNLRMERNAEGEVTIMSPVMYGSGTNEGHLFGYLYAWNLPREVGEVFSPSTGFILGGQEMRCSDASFIFNERLVEVKKDPDYLDKFVEVVPDFIVEVVSKSDRLTEARAKMHDVWMAYGVRLGWLIDTKRQQAFIYRAGQEEPEIVTDFVNGQLTGEDVLPEFTFPLGRLNV